MSVPTGTTVPGTAGPLTARRVSGLRRASFAAFVMLVVQFAVGIYVSLYVTVPSADHGHGFGQAIANGPAGLTLHIVLGLLLILAALGFLVQAILARQPALIADAIDHGWMRKFVEHRIADKRVLRLIQKWLTGSDRRRRVVGKRGGSPPGFVMRSCA
jgi:hypothetical protein